MKKFMHYKQLSLEQRLNIQYYKLIKKLSNRKISKLIGVHHSTVSREVKRNSVTLKEPLCDKYTVKYEAHTANKKYIGRRAKNRENATPEIIEITEGEIKKFIRQLEIYYCDPGKPQQKGQVEWFNKQPRRFLNIFRLIASVQGVLNIVLIYSIIKN